MTEIPGGKTDVNINPRPLGFPFGEENAGYIEGTPQGSGANSPASSKSDVGIALLSAKTTRRFPCGIAKWPGSMAFRRMNSPKTAIFPRSSTFVRGGGSSARRRLRNTTSRSISNGFPAAEIPDTIALGEFPIDSFPCRKRETGQDRALEGYLSMLYKITRPYRIPYRIMIPASVDGLIVPVAASTTHVAFSTIRMEPCWMAMGQAAGTAASMAVRLGRPLRSLSMTELRQRLRSEGQVPRPAGNPSTLRSQIEKWCRPTLRLGRPTRAAIRIIGKIDTD